MNRLWLRVFAIAAIAIVLIFAGFGCSQQQKADTPAEEEIAAETEAAPAAEGEAAAEGAEAVEGEAAPEAEGEAPAEAAPEAAEAEAK